MGSVVRNSAGQEREPSIGRPIPLVVIEARPDQRNGLPFIALVSKARRLIHVVELRVRYPCPSARFQLVASSSGPPSRCFRRQQSRLRPRPNHGTSTRQGSGCCWIAEFIYRLISEPRAIVQGKVHRQEQVTKLSSVSGFARAAHENRHSTSRPTSKPATTPCATT